MIGKDNAIFKSSGKFNLEVRTFKFAQDVFALLKKAERSVENEQLIKQLARSSTSVGANYIEANNYLGKKDFLHKMGICKKEAKESKFWLGLIALRENSPEMLKQKEKLIGEANELTLIFAAIHKKVVAHKVEQ